MDSLGLGTDPFLLILALVGLSLAPFIAVMVTSFAKLAIVMFLIRNALGIQEIPPNVVLYGLALILSVYIMAPVGMATFERLQAADLSEAETGVLLQELGGATAPWQEFLHKHSDPETRRFFLEAADRLWPEAMQRTVDENNLLILVPSFTASELRRGFEIGFLIYLPFVVIDLVVSNILLAMGMMMVSPMTISLPFKLFLFVLVDGWSRLIQGLVLSYA
ncbi:MAG TPA: type III secretion system export apparatus subunit SctR [Geminicoccaceae bacterium]|nr:type III secretion system export apparatus subunit SctR [Geminicoccaceae bacterium]